jgi:MFS family permease
MKRIQTVSIIGFVLSYASFSLATNVIHLYISSFFTGIFFLNASLIPVSMMITNWFVKKRGLAMSIAMAGIGVGGTIFSPVITWLLGAYGWRSTYRIMALIILVLALPAALFILRKRPEDMGLLPYGSEDAAIQDAASKRIPKKADIVFPLSVKESRTKLFFILFIFGMLCNGLINTGSLGHFPPAIEELQGPQVQALIISMYSMIGIFGKLVLGWLNDRFGVVVSTAFGCITFALSFIFILFGRNISMLYIMAFLFGLGDAIGTVTPPLITSAIFGAEKYGEAYGIANSFTQIGLSLGALMVAAVYDTSGSYNTAWILLIILTLGAFAGWVGAYAVSRKYCQKSVADNT